MALKELMDEYTLWFEKYEGYGEGTAEWGDTLRVAIAALEKQIPKTPVHGRDEAGHEGWFCPECGALEVLAGDEEYLNNYCRICGQKMEWEVSDE